MSNAGDLRKKMAFAKPDDVFDEYGNSSTGWQDMFTLHAQITPRLGGETVEAARLAGQQPVVIRLRYSPNAKQIRTDWQATDIDSGIVYNVRAVTDPFLGNARHGQWVDVLAEAGVAV